MCLRVKHVFGAMLHETHSQWKGEDEKQSKKKWPIKKSDSWHSGDSGSTKPMQKPGLGCRNECDHLHAAHYSSRSMSAAKGSSVAAVAVSNSSKTRFINKTYCMYQHCQHAA